ncbi:MAG: sensor domain-containing diguanylate cyclase [Acidobacteria bacterium]|nr:MAG: sensor domain-containing diguanylate cyclase [Acidobacteriota bacterium]
MTLPQQPSELSQAKPELAILHDVAKALTSSLNLDSVLQTIMEKVAAYFRPDTWSLLMTDDEHQELYFAIAVGDASDSLKSIRLRIGEGIAGWVAKHGEPVVVPDVMKDERFSSRVDQVTKCKTKSILCVPLASKSRVLGVIQLINVNMSRFGIDQFMLLQALADYAAIAIDNARAVEKIQELTITDDCTGLYNARHLTNSIESEVYRSNRFGYEFSILFLDLDYFKLVNDNFGHLIGSRLLFEIGSTIRSNLRLIDYAFRYGGDEFVVLLPQTGKMSALIVARRLRDILRNTTFHIGGYDLNIRASMGVASFPEDARNAHDLIRQADEMMYTIKNTTRDAIAVCGIGATI